MITQLDIFGGEAPAVPLQKAGPPLTSAQREILRLAARPEGVRSNEAGAAVHAQRHAGKRCNCPLKWVGTDGSDAMRRLVARGFVVQRDPRGPYFPAWEESA